MTTHSPKQFSQLVKSEKYTLVFYTANYCGPCKRYYDEFDSIMNHVRDSKKLAAVKVYIDDNDGDKIADLCIDSLSIRSTPLFVIYSGGKHKKWSVGSPKDLGEQFARLIEKINDAEAAGVTYNIKN